MASRHKSRREALDEAIAIVYRVDIVRLRRNYGAGVASEVLRQLANGSLKEPTHPVSRGSR
jgi:hypothetical protein